MNTNIFKHLFKNQKSETLTKYQLVTERGNGTFIWNGKIYDSDIVRACLAPYIKAIGKLDAKHLFKDKTNPEPYIKSLLENPNPLMSMQKLQEKMAAQLVLNGNSFTHITRDENGYPVELFPLPAVGVEAIYIKSELFLKFTLNNGKEYTYPYEDIIHLRSNFFDNDVFGSSLMPTLTPLLTISNTIDDGIVKAIKNSSLIRWLLKATSSIRSDDLKKLAKEFSESFLDATSETGGVAATDSKVEAQQIDSKDYVPNFEILKSVKERIYGLFGVNEKIVQGSYNEDEWNSFYESSIEPIALDFSNEFTRKLFSANKRSYGNRIVFESSSLTCASINTKLSFLQMVDRGAMTPNEWRKILNLSPIDGGDIPVRRLDTAPTVDKGGDSE